MSKICQSCGTENRDLARFCVGCGSPFKEEENYTDQTSQLSSEEKKNALGSLKEKIDPQKMDQAKNIAKKATEKATTLAKATATKAKEVKNEIENHADKSLQVQEKNTPEKAITKEGTIQLWSSLKKEFNRRQFYIDIPEKEISREEFFVKLEEKLTENEIPAFIERSDVQWDRSKLIIDSYLVTPITKSAVPYTYLLQFNKVGKFTFIESRIFIAPPDLPYIPKQLNKDRLIVIAVLAGLSFLFAFSLSAPYKPPFLMRLMSTLFSLVALGLLYYFIYMFVKIWRRNKEVILARQKWNEAWEEWYRKSFINEYEEIVDGSLSRIYDSINVSIDQVDEALFNQDPVREKESYDMNTITALVNRNKEEYR